MFSHSQRQAAFNTGVSGNAWPSFWTRSATVACVALQICYEPGQAQTARGRDAGAIVSFTPAILNLIEIEHAGRARPPKNLNNEPLDFGDIVRTFDALTEATIEIYPVGNIKTKQTVSMEGRAECIVPREDGVFEILLGRFSFLKRSSAQASLIKTKTIIGASRKTDFMVEVVPDGGTLVYVGSGELHLTNATPVFGDTDTMVLTNGEAMYAAGGTEKLKKISRLDMRVRGLVQSFVYYPGLLHLADLDTGLSGEPSLSQSIAAYSEGNLPRALLLYPTNAPKNNSEKLYKAALVLTTGEYARAQSLLTNLAPSEAGYEKHARLAAALQQVIAATEGQEWHRADAPTTATEWLAESYYQQSRAGRPFRPDSWETTVYRPRWNALDRALAAAKEATPPGSTFGFGWVRRAELEFSFGRAREAQWALAQANGQTNGNAQALALLGFIKWAQQDFTGSLARFRAAAALDGGLANAWLGIGLTELHGENLFENFKSGNLFDWWRARPDASGLRHLEVAAATEPNRSLLRSYLAKAYYDSSGWWGQNGFLRTNAFQQLELAKWLDPFDPTPYLYSALIFQQEYQINEAVRELERSIQLNSNRQIYRSSLLLDQDQAVRSANLAAIYQDAGMIDWSVYEASRAVSYDYANYSAHLFLANSYNALRDPSLINLRYETPTFNEYLLANLLAPVGGALLSPLAYDQGYTRLFQKDSLGFASATEYSSDGSWDQAVTQYGIVDDFSYALDATWRSNRGHRPNNDLEQFLTSAQFKVQLTSQDSLYFLAAYSKVKSGDLRQLYDETQSALGLRVTEQQEPNLFAGYDREWAPGVHTLFLVARLDDTLILTDTNAVIRVLQRDPNNNAVLQQGEFGDFGWNYQSEFDAYSAEVQQVVQSPEQLLLAGARYQWGSTKTTSVLTRDPGEAPGSIFPTLPQNTTTALERVSLYAYVHRQVYNRLWLIAGVSYDRLRFPDNISSPPINNHEISTDQVSPKAGFLWSPFEQTTIRGAFTHSLGGLFYDSSVRLEPTEVAGFVQSYRSLIPESLAGSIPGSQFETASLGFGQRLETSTYITLDAELLKSTAHQTIGVFDYQSNALTAEPSGTGQQFEFEERSLALGVSQLFAGGGTVGARYRISRAELQSKFEEIPSSVFPGAQTDERATLQDLTLFALYQFPTGFFAQVDAIWRAQENQGYTPPRPREDFWQFNLFAGYRFAQRRAEVALGLLNLTGRNYRLNPLNVVSELPRQRTLVVSLKLNF